VVLDSRLPWLQRTGLLKPTCVMWGHGSGLEGAVTVGEVREDERGARK